MSIEKQIDEITMAIEEAAYQEGTHYTVKQMEKTGKTWRRNWSGSMNQTRKDEVVNV